MCVYFLDTITGQHTVIMTSTKFMFSSCTVEITGMTTPAMWRAWNTERYKEFTRNARRIEHHFKKISDAKKRKIEAVKAAGKEPASSSDDDQIPAVTSDVEIDMEAMMDKLDDNVQNAASNPSVNNVQNIVNMDSRKDLDDNLKNVSDIVGENKQPPPIQTNAAKHEEQQQEEKTDRFK